jgi:hypothetical protein
VVAAAAAPAPSATSGEGGATVAAREGGAVVAAGEGSGVELQREHGKEAAAAGKEVGLCLSPLSLSLSSI